jgi:hypothetical protein
VAVAEAQARRERQQKESISMGDNFHIDISAEGDKTLGKAIDLAFNGRTAEGYIIGDFGLCFLWSLYEKRSGTVAFPFKCNAEAAADFARRWLAEADYGRQPDHDGDNEKGWHVYNDAWGQVAGMHGSIVAVKPDWQMYRQVTVPPYEEATMAEQREPGVYHTKKCNSRRGPQYPCDCSKPRILPPSAAPPDAEVMARGSFRSFEAAVHPAMRETVVKCMAHLITAATMQERKACLDIIHKERQSLGAHPANWVHANALDRIYNAIQRNQLKDVK